MDMDAEHTKRKKLLDDLAEPHQQTTASWVKACATPEGRQRKVAIDIAMANSRLEELSRVQLAKHIEKYWV